MAFFSNSTKKIVKTKHSHHENAKDHERRHGSGSRHARVHRAKEEEQRQRRPEETDSDFVFWNLGFAHRPRITQPPKRIAAAKGGSRINASYTRIFSDAQLHILKLVAHSITLCA